MYQFNAHNLVKLVDELHDLEIELKGPSPNDTRPLIQRFANHIKVIETVSNAIGFSSSHKQSRYIIEYVSDKTVAGEVVSAMLTELRRRIREDMEDHIYYCIPESEVPRFFKHTNSGYQPKVASELMDPSIVGRFPSASDDIEAAYKCFVFDCFPASMFHLMRVVEVGVLELAQVVDVSDPKPSWGSILKRVEKIVLRTEYEDVDPKIRPHRKMLESLLPQMQAIQRAWRNKFNHVGTNILPADGTITGPIAFEILTAVEAFMRQLAADLPIDASGIK